MQTIDNSSLAKFYESVIENAESNVLIIDCNFNIVTLNEGFYRMFMETYHLHLKKGDNLFGLMSPVLPQLSEKWKHRCATALKGISVSDEEEVEVLDQTFFWKIYYKSVSLGGQEFISVFSRNVTSVKLFQNRIIQHEANLRTIINSFSASIWLVNEHLDLIDFNENTFFHFVKTYQVRLLASRNFIELLPSSLPELREMWRNRMTLVLTTREKTSFIDYRSVDAKELVCETAIMPVISEGKVIGLTLCMEDITQKRIDEQVKRTQLNELMKLNSELDKFVYSASHDLRAPLLSIIGVVNLMKKDSASDALYLKHIESSVVKLDNVLTNIINYSRNNKLEVVPEEIDFIVLMGEVMESLSYLEGAEIVNCTHVVDQKIPFHTDKDRLFVIFNNIISNSFQYFDTWKTPELHISIHVDEHSAAFRFEDNGIGIKPEICERAFDMFFRGSDRSKGSGLGLYVVKNAVQKLNGIIDLRSTLGKGTIVELEIPNLYNSESGQ